LDTSPVWPAWLKRISTTDFSVGSVSGGLAVVLDVTDWASTFPAASLPIGLSIVSACSVFFSGCAFSGVSIAG
jgi:hypothetical protein